MRGKVAKKLRRAAREIARNYGAVVERELLFYERRTHGESKRRPSVFAINNPSSVRGIYRAGKKAYVRAA